MAPRLRAPGTDDAAFLFRLAAQCDLRWPAVSRFNAFTTPLSVLTALQSSTEVGYLVLDRAREPVGVIGLVDPDVPSQVVWLDGHAAPGDHAALRLVRDAVPVVLDEAARSGNIRFAYYDEIVELEESLIEDHVELWEAEVRIPQYVRIDGVWCTRVTHRLDLEAWADR